MKIKNIVSSEILYVTMFLLLNMSLLGLYRRQFDPTVLHRIATHGTAAELRRELAGAAGFDLRRAINVRDDDGWTPLHRAVFRGDTGIIQGLLENHANVEARTIGGNTPLILAVIENKPAVVHELLSRTADPDAVNNNPESPYFGLTPLHIAVQRGYEPIVRDLLAWYVDVNVRDQIGSTPLHYAILANNPHMIELLLRAGADISIRNLAGSTALELATSEPVRAIFRLLRPAEVRPARHGVTRDVLRTSVAGAVTENVPVRGVCPLCLENKELVRWLPSSTCLHRFCQECKADWIRSGTPEEPRTCPTCRQLPQAPT